MKNIVLTFLLITVGVLLTSCNIEDEKASDQAAAAPVSVCDLEESIAKSAEVGDVVSGPEAEEDVKKVFAQCGERTEYDSSSTGCWNNITFSRFNESTFDFDYYVSIHTSCGPNEVITDIFKSN